MHVWIGSFIIIVYILDTTQSTRWRGVCTGHLSSACTLASPFVEQRVPRTAEDIGDIFLVHITIARVILGGAYPGGGREPARSGTLDLAWHERRAQHNHLKTPKRQAFTQVYGSLTRHLKIRTSSRSSMTTAELTMPSSRWAFFKLSLPCQLAWACDPLKPRMWVSRWHPIITTSSNFSFLLPRNEVTITSSWKVSEGLPSWNSWKRLFKFRKSRENFAKHPRLPVKFLENGKSLFFCCK